MTYDLSTDWIKRIDTSRQAVLDKDDKIIKKVGVIEPDALLTGQTIGIYVSSQSANPNWYRAGDLYQAFLVGFGEGYAQGEQIRVTLNRYITHRFTRFPYLEGETKYLLSYIPEQYLKDVRLQVWEYVGTNQGVSNEDLKKTINAVGQRVANLAPTVNQIKELAQKINKKL